MHPLLLSTARPPRAALLFALSVALLGARAQASDAPAHSAAPRVERAEKASTPAAPVLASSAPPAAPEPMTKLRQLLSAKLGATASADSGKSDVISVAVKSPPSNGRDADTRALPGVPERRAHRPAGKESPHAAGGEHAAHWDYEGLAGPAAWSTLKPEFAKCSSGTRQSPIDIQGGIRVELEPVQFDYKPSAFRVLDNGHTVQVNVAAGNSIEVNGRRFALVQFHFHRPSEERIDGKQFDMVAHLVHKDLDGRLAVVAVLFERGSAHAVVQSVWNNLPLEKGEEQPARAPMNVADLLPADRGYFTYMGSLTTPPCSEGVLWMVMKTPVAIAPAQIDIFAHLYPMNARPVQASAGRLIKQSN